MYSAFRCFWAWMSHFVRLIAIAWPVLGPALGSNAVRAQSFSSASTTGAYCSDLKHIAGLAGSKDLLASIAGNSRQGNFVETTLPLAGWHDCSLYGATTYTCDSPAVDTADEAESVQANILDKLKSCLGETWSEATGQSSARYVILRNLTQPISVTLSVDQTDNRKHVVRLILFVRRR